MRTSSFGESSSLPLKYVAQKTTVLPSNIVRILGKIGGSTNIKAYRIQPNPFFTPNPSSPTNPKKLAAKIREEILIAQAQLASKKSWQEVGVYHASILMFHPKKLLEHVGKGCIQTRKMGRKALRYLHCVATCTHD